MRSVLFVLAALAALTSPALAQEAPKSVVLVTIDGLRWEELFRGADPNLVRDETTHARYIDVPDRVRLRGADPDLRTVRMDPEPRPTPPVLAYESCPGRSTREDSREKKACLSEFLLERLASPRYKSLAD